MFHTACALHIVVSPGVTPAPFSSSPPPPRLSCRGLCAFYTRPGLQFWQLKKSEKGLSWERQEFSSKAMNGADN